MKYLRLLLMVFAVVGLISTSAFAGQILKATGVPVTLTPFSAYPTIASSYKSALEIYSPGGTNTSSTTGIVAIRFAATEWADANGDGSFNAPLTVTFILDSDAEFTSGGGNFVWVLTNDPTWGVNSDIYAASAPGVTTSTLALASGNVDCTSNATGVCDMPPATDIYLVQAAWNDGDGDGLVEIGELGAATNVSTTLRNKAADCNTTPVWSLRATASGTEGTLQFPTLPTQAVSFTYVTPQFTVTGPAVDELSAELDSDADFQTFVLGSGPNVNSSTQIWSQVAAGTGFFNIVDSSTVDPFNWISWTSGVNGNITFDLRSATAEPGITGITFNGNPCPETTTDLVWRCNSGALTPAIGPYDVIINVSGTTSNNPTVWTIENITFPAGLCVNTAARTVGAWYGGVEAVVPFVKYDPSVGAQTYIVFYNRRDVDVPVYAAAMLQNSDPVIVSTNQIATIPAHSRIQFTADQLQTLLPELAGYNMAQGVPIKFLFRVPSQSTINNVSLTIPAVTVTAVNPLDPYIDGIVVSVYGSVQRSVPLKFKAFKQGNYNE